jgi:hypothetical protein
MKLKKIENQLKSGVVPENLDEFFDFTKTEIYTQRVCKEIALFNSNLEVRAKKKNFSLEMVENKKKEFKEKVEKRLSKDAKFILSIIRFPVIEEFLADLHLGPIYWLTWLPQVDAAKWYFAKTHNISGGGYEQKGILIIEYKGETYNIPQEHPKYQSLISGAVREAWDKRKPAFIMHLFLEKYFNKEQFDDFLIINCKSNLYINLLTGKLEEEALY